MTRSSLVSELVFFAPELIVNLLHIQVNLMA